MIGYNVVRYGVFRRFISEDVRKQLYVQCLNREFDEVLTQVRQIPVNEIDYGFLQLYLARSCAWGHIESVDYLWHRYVIKNHILVIRPHILCELSNLALANNKFFVTKQVYEYFGKMYGSKRYDVTLLKWKYELLRIKIESFAKGTGECSTFSEKWKVFLEDMDNALPVTTKFSVRDFSNLGKALHHDIETGNVTEPILLEMLFTEKKISIKNPSTLPLLLNLVLLQPTFSKSFKLGLFKRFYGFHPQLDHDDSVIILCRLLKGDGYNLAEVIDFAAKLDEGNLQLSAKATRLLIEGIQDTTYSFKLNEHAQLSKLAGTVKT